MLIKNVLPHPDDLHDGRPIGAYATAEITKDDLQLEHYQCRLRDGLMVLVDEGEPVSVEVEAPASAPEPETPTVETPAEETAAEETSASKPAQPVKKSPSRRKRAPKGASKETA